MAVLRWERALSQVSAFGDKVAFIWSVADVLRGDYKADKYGRVLCHCCA